MEAAISQHDTLALEPPPGGATEPAVLARLPHVGEPTTERHTRVDGPTDVLATRGVPAEPPRLEPTDTVRVDTPTRPAPPTAETTEVTSWLLRLEEAVLPYSRWVVLAAVIAALGLALTLLRTAPVSVVDPTASDARLVDAVEPPAYEPFEQQADAADDRAPATLASASGPQGMPPQPAPRARLTQTVLPIAGDAAAPRTASAEPEWAAAEGSARR